MHFSLVQSTESQQRDCVGSHLSSWALKPLANATPKSSQYAPTLKFLKCLFFLITKAITDLCKRKNGWKIQNKQKPKITKEICNFGLAYYLTFGFSWMLGLISVTAEKLSGLQQQWFITFHYSVCWLGSSVSCAGMTRRSKMVSFTLLTVGWELNWTVGWGLGFPSLRPLYKTAWASSQPDSWVQEGEY